jgi:hypothetical protein
MKSLKSIKLENIESSSDLLSVLCTWMSMPHRITDQCVCPVFLSLANVHYVLQSQLFLFHASLVLLRLTRTAGW